jgi:chloramphenicol O-acetyltransferase
VNYLKKKEGAWRLLGAYKKFQNVKNENEDVTNTNGHVFAIRIKNKKIEYVDCEGSLLNFLHTDNSKIQFEDYDFESKTSVFLMIYLSGVIEYNNDK